MAYPGGKNLDWGDLWALGYYDDIIKAVRRKYPATSVMRKMDVIEAWRRGAFPGYQLGVKQWIEAFCPRFPLTDSEVGWARSIDAWHLGTIQEVA
jgi:hypothetical protein